ncbi:MAG TPA: TadE family protein [Chloroflexota bacterium]
MSADPTPLTLPIDEARDGRRALHRAGSRIAARGQGTLEFALALPVLFFAIVAIIELGFGLYSYVNVMYAAKDGARAGAIYAYDPGCDGDSDPSNDQANNDLNRLSGTGCLTPYNDNIRASVTRGLNALKTGAPYFDPASDISVSYDSSVGSALAARKGQLLTVQVTYRHYWMSGVFSNSFVTFTSNARAKIE